MAQTMQLWAEVVHADAPALPTVLENLVHRPEGDPAAWTLSALADSEQRAVFMMWRTQFVDTLLVAAAADAQVASVWLRRKGAARDLTADLFLDQAAVTGLWWACDEMLPPLPAFDTLTRNLQAVADLAAERQRGVTFRARPSLVPEHQPA